jgi:radical SAM-linked protein
MKVRIKFTKTGPLKFVGHLDIMRYFQKAFRRADLDVEYSQGFNPHQLTSFAAPLGVGLTSDGEYMDASMHSSEAPEIMINRINEAMNEFIQVIDYRFLSDNSKNAMSIVAGADYLVSLKDDFDYLDKSDFQHEFMEFYKQNSIVITKKSKKSENEVDIKPMIYQVAFDREEFNKLTGSLSDGNLSVAEVYDNGVTVYMQLATGSVNNLKPELVMEAFSQYRKEEYKEALFQVHRLEVYADAGDIKNRKLVPLAEIK